MSNASDASQNIPRSAIKSVTAGGESVQIDTEKLEAAQREEQNSDLANIINRRVRPYQVRMKIRNPYG